MIVQPATSNGFRPQRSASHPAGRTTIIQATMLTANASASIRSGACKSRLR